MICYNCREIWQNNQHCQAATSLFVIIRLSNPTTSLSSDSAHLTDTDPITSLWLCSVFVYFLKKVSNIWTLIIT